MASLCLQTDRFLRVLLHSGQYLLEQGQGYRVRKQYEVIGIRAGYPNTAWIDFITTDDQCGGVHFQARGAAVRVYFDSDWTASTIPPPPALFRGWSGGGRRPRLLFTRALVVESGGGQIMLFHSRLYWRPGGFAFFPSRRGAQQFAVRPLQLASFRRFGAGTDPPCCRGRVQGG